MVSLALRGSGLMISEMGPAYEHIKLKNKQTNISLALQDIHLYFRQYCYKPFSNTRSNAQNRIIYNCVEFQCRQFSGKHTNSMKYNRFEGSIITLTCSVNVFSTVY